MMLTPPRKATVVRRFFFDFSLPRDRKWRAKLAITVFPGLLSSLVWPKNSIQQI
ncbi:hypothetical protein [Mesorhizobium sp. 131-3-5]|uniref:hypothetical protein n=1 Tax=Mesorhizobium sp. 131-3-5 TaxID=2744520 RepID=UPI000376CC89|nr:MULTISPECIES: hypothetical protein [Mesorhizobium]